MKPLYPFDQLQGIEFTFTQTVATGGTFVRIFHCGAFSGFIFYHLQHVMLASFDATTASGTVTVHNTDDFVPVFPLAVQVEGNPQKEHDSQANIYYIHFLLFLPFIR
jgi:hypothetical protein